MQNDKHPDLSPNALSILRRRYLKDGEEPDDMFRRVARAVASGEKDPDRLAENEETFYDLMRSLRFLPNSPTLVNAGVEDAGSLSACYTISPDDDMQSIMQIASDAAMIEKSGGGVGFGFSRLRPKNDAIKTTHGKACGPVAVMKLYSAVGQTLTQGAFREGAHMGQLAIDHPDIREFIHCKDGDDTLANFNISVQVPDDFFEILECDGDIQLVNPRNRGDGPENAPAGSIPARELWDEIVQSAWKTGDPGIVFMDRVHETAPNPQLGPILTSNPCSEEFLEDYGNCCLGSINLARHLSERPDGKPHVDWDLLERTVRDAVRFLDSVIDVNTFPISKLRQVNLATRRIGLGVMGWADMLVMLGLPYNSDEALKLADKTARFINEVAWEESARLAGGLGPFPEYERSALAANGRPPVRHSSVFTIAPTGTISRIADCSSGIEPHYSLVYRSNVLWQEGRAGATLHDAPAPLVQMIRRATDRDLQDVLTEIFESPERIAEYADPSLFQTSHQVEPLDHVRMQAAWQKWVTNGVSKTINMPNTATAQEVAEAYRTAWELGCKAVSIYRDGSKSQQVLETAETEATREQEPRTENGYIKPADRPKRLQGITDRIESGSGRLYVAMNEHRGRMFEVFINLGKSKADEEAHLEAVSRLISLALRAGVHPMNVTEQLAGITSTPAWDNGTLVLSPEDGVAKLMNNRFLELEGRGPGIKPPEISEKSQAQETDRTDDEAPDMSAALAARETCPQPGCSGMTIYVEGCRTCQTCGHSKCD